MIRYAVLLVTVFILTVCCQARETAIYRDGSGRLVGRSETSGSRTVYRDASGRISTTAETITQIPALPFLEAMVVFVFNDFMQ